MQDEPDDRPEDFFEWADTYAARKAGAVSGRDEVELASDVLALREGLRLAVEEIRRLAFAAPEDCARMLAEWDQVMAKCESLAGSLVDVLDARG